MSLCYCRPSHPNFSSYWVQSSYKSALTYLPDSSTIIPSFPKQSAPQPRWIPQYWTHLCSYKNTISFTDCSLYLQGLSSTLPCPSKFLTPFKTYLTSHLLTEAFFLTPSLTVTPLLHPLVALCTCLCYTTYYIISEWQVSISPTKPRRLTCHTLLHLQCFMGQRSGGDPVSQKVIKPKI